MWTVFSLNGRRYLRNPVTLGGSLLLFLLFGLMSANLLPQTPNGLQFLGRLAAFQPVLLLGFLFLSYFFVSTGRRRQTEAALRPLPGALSKQLLGQFAVLALAALLIALSIFGFTVWMDFSTFRTSPLLLWHYLKVCCLDFWGVSVLAIAAGGTVALLSQKALGVSLLLLLAFLFTPVSQELAADLSTPQANLSPLVDLFALQVSNPQTSFYLPSYGIPNEPVRWLRVLFFTLLFLSLWFWGSARTSRLKGRLPSLLLSGCALLSLGGYLSQRQNGLYYGYDRQRAVPSVVSSLGAETYFDEPADFAVTRYTADLTIHGQLSATVRAEIEGGLTATAYPFTLYRGYRLESVEDDLGNPLPHTVERDYLTVFPADSRATAIVFTYRGNGDMFYSNSQGVYLPGYFPFYPMPGKKILHTGEGFTTPIDTRPKQFDVTVHTRAPNLFCSLPSVEDGVRFAGDSDTFSLAAGLIQAEEREGITIVKPIVGTSDQGGTFGVEGFPPLDEAAAVRQMFEDYQALARLCGVEESASLPTAILSAGETLPMSDHWYLFRDHWRTSSLTSPRNNAIMAFQTRPEFLPLLTFYGKSMNAAQVMASAGLRTKVTLWDNLMVHYNRPGRFFDFALESRYDLESYYYPLLLAINQKGEESVYRSVYQYISDPDDTRTPRQLFADMGVDLSGSALQPVEEDSYAD